MIKSRFLYLSTVLITLLTGCSKTREQEILVQSVSLSQSTAEMVVGETVQLKALVLPSDATDKTVQWSSSKVSVATINNSGFITAISEGVSTVTASVGGKSATCRITVCKPFIAVTSITLDKTELSLVKGQTETLKATIKPDDATDCSVIWGISNTAVATVDDNGIVTALSGGSAIITAKAGMKVATCSVNVTIPVKSITLDRESITLEEDSYTTLAATVKPDDATNKTVIWSSSDTDIATVDQRGIVIAIKEGTATITASADEQSTSCTVTVKKKFIAVSYIILNKEDLELNKGQTETLVAVVKPDDATDMTVSWSSSNTAVATVDSNGKVTAVTGGDATIFAKAGEKQAACKVTVTVPVSAVSLNKETLTLVEGESETLVATIEPQNATDKSCKWSSSNKEVAMVNNEGKVTAIKAGEAIITVEAGDKSASCRVMVNNPFIPVKGISLSRTSVELNKGNSVTLVATVTPSNATDPSITWKSSDESIATVDQNGKVTAINSGSTTITAKAGEQQASCTISVIIPVTGITLNTTSLSMGKGQSSTLVATVSPADATDKSVSWTSSDTKVVTVTNGTVTSVGGGMAEITAKTNDGGYEAKCVVEVKVPVQGVSLNSTSLNIYQYDEVVLIASVFPSDASNKAVTWSSDNPSIVSVDSNGKIIGKSGGSATITVETKDGNYTAQCYVTVTADAHKAVDLGLSVKWATTNYGTTSSTATGGYYMWGDPTGTATAVTYTAPNVNSISGTGYDIVRKNWGGSWRIPSRTELGELYSKCTWKQETVSGVSVFRVTGPNGNSIIIPFTGLGYPASGPAGTKQYMSMDRVYLMSGNSYSDEYGRFAYVYYYSQNGNYNWESYNADLVYITIRPVR